MDSPILDVKQESTRFHGVTIEDIKQWEQGANPPRKEDIANENYVEIWNKIVHLIQEATGKGKVPTTFLLDTLVIMSNDEVGGVVE